MGKFWKVENVGWAGGFDFASIIAGPFVVGEKTKKEIQEKCKKSGQKVRFIPVKDKK